MIELRPEVKEIIEKHIKLIEQNEWDEFFELLQNEWVPQIIGKVAETLESCEIFPLATMTFIPEGYFWLSNKLTEYIVPSNIQRICYKAFESSDIEKVQITSNVFDVGQSAFIDCDFLETVVVDEGVEYIEDSCFYSCDALENVTLPKSLKRLGHNVFNRCDILTTVHYQGTMSDWKHVQNHEFIDEGSYVSTIVCSDGEIKL